MGVITDDLRSSGAELRETHISWVFLLEDRVWKIKKPVALGFLDFSTADKRRAACDAEVELNRRLAPEVYLGVEPVCRDAAGHHQINGNGEIVDWAVHMRRLPDDDRGDLRLARGALDRAHLERLAEMLAAFHARARSDDHTAQFGSVDAIRRNVRENFEQSRESIRDLLGAEQAAEIEAWQLGFLERRADLFDRRVQTGRVRDGHGDLRLEQIYFHEDGATTVLDCIEFNERFRYADVCADISFLAMDLAWHGRVDLAEATLAAYARAANDYDLYPLVDFYESYRAYVRGKVASILAADPGADPRRRRRAADEARRYFLLAVSSERRTLLPPAVVAVGGIIGSGKSTVASQIAAEMSSAVVDSDRTRKHIVGVAAMDPLLEEPWRGAYAPETTWQVYEEMMRRASCVLAAGRPVVLDATFASREQRREANDLAERHGVPFYFVECRAEPERIRRRLAARARAPHVSDGRLEILDDLMAAWEPLEAAEGLPRFLVDTALPLEQNMDALREQLPTWPPGMTE